MHARSLALNAVRIGAVVFALAILLVTPAIIESPAGRSYEPLGIATDAVALMVLIAVAWTALGPRFRSHP